jgi:Swi5-dependent recombination DNA repair protein 1
MGGPRAFKEMQKKQQEFHNRWDEEEQTIIEPDEADTGDSSTEKRDLYAEYDIDEETENEKSQRLQTNGDTGEMPGQEDVSNFVT